MIYIVDDDLEDVELMRRGLDESEQTFTHFRNGEELLSELSGLEDSRSVSWPKLILLDLNMPVMNGRETLSWIKANSRFSNVPVIILSSSRCAEEIEETYRLGANSFVAKPDSLVEFSDAIRKIEDYWLRFVKLPNWGQSR